MEKRGKKTMMVCGHGDVAEFCEAHGMLVCEKHDGAVCSYRGTCRVLVTDQDMSEQEYYFLKGKLFGRGIELISTKHQDIEGMRELLTSQTKQRNNCRSGRNRFGFRRENGVVVPTTTGMVVGKRILEMRDAGYTLKQISEDAGVHHPDGRKISISTIQQIIKNRKWYEER